MRARPHYDLDAWTVSFLVVCCLFFAGALIYPVSFTLKQAFFHEGRFTLRFFELALSSPLQRESIWNSSWIALVTTVGITILTFPLAHLLTRYRFSGKGLLTTLLLVPMIMPPFVGAIGLKQLLAKFGSLNLLLMNAGLLHRDHPIDWLGRGGVWGIVILQVLSLYPIMLLNLTASMANIDPAMHEAAQNLGANGWRIFRTVTLPLVLPGFFGAAIMVFIWAFTDLGTPLVFGFSRVVPVQIFDGITELNTNPMGFALVVLVLLLTVVLFLFSKNLIGTKRYEMLSRSHAAGEIDARPADTALIWAFAGSLVALALLPHLMVIIQSLSGRWFFTPLPENWTLSNFREVFAHGLTSSSIRNSLFYSSISASLDLILGVMIAWLLTRKRIPFAGLLDALAMLPLALPGLVLAFGYVAGFDFKISWLNPRQNPTLLLIISYSVRRLPYVVRSAYAGFQQTSITLEEASANLGAGPFRTLRKITLPLIFAHLVAGTILTFSFAMLEVSDSLILAMREEYFPITKTIWQILGRIEPNAPSIASALGVVGMGILALSLILASRVLGKKLGQLFRS